MKERKRERERERHTHTHTHTHTDTDTDTWFIVKATDPYTRRELGGGGGGERILHFSTIFDDLMDDVHCSVYFYHFTLYSHEHKYIAFVQSAG